MRVVTRGDVDGLACAVLLSEMEDVESIRFAHPKDMQDGLIDVGDEDVIANLPYRAGCAMWFDHHVSEEGRIPDVGPFRGRYGKADSAARLIYEYYERDEKLARFADFLDAVDRVDAARLSVADVTDPQGWIRVAYTIDPRSNLGRYREYFTSMVEWIRTKSLDEILALPEVDERVRRVLENQERFAAQLREHSRMVGPVVLTDFRGLDEVPMGNRYLVYTLFPEAEVSLRLSDGKYGLVTILSVGHSLFRKGCAVDVGKLMAAHGGGGHTGAGTCQVPSESAEETIAAVLRRLGGTA